MADGAGRLTGRRQSALSLAEELLSQIELGAISPREVLFRTSRLARLLDDTEALAWLSYEINGYRGPLGPAALQAAERSNREAASKDSERFFTTTALGSLDIQVRTALDQLTSSTGGQASGDWAFRVEVDRRAERQALRRTAMSSQDVIDKVIGQLHNYVSAKFQELRFGAAAESAFELVRNEVDGAIGDLVPDALPMLSAAFENARSENSEDWAAAAATCRRLLKVVADALRPPGPDVSRGNRTVRMRDGNYVNRLVDWIQSQTDSATMVGLIAADLEYLGKRLDAFDKAGQKGAHETVDRVEASRFIAGTYLLLGDILRLRPAQREEAIEIPDSQSQPTAVHSPSESDAE